MTLQMTTVAIPDDIDFADLRLARETDGSVSLDFAVIERICEASNLPLELFHDETENNISGLIFGWYQSHRSQGGIIDPVAEDLIAEVEAEEIAGQSFSHQPGRA